MAQLKIKLNTCHLPITMFFSATNGEALSVNVDQIETDGYVLVSNGVDYTNYQAKLLEYARQYYTNGEESALVFETL